ncbi:glyoxal oxidase-like protein [Nitrosomonas sp. Nm84]|uniref:glyoxal oxidase n=1 Tax=Nitrosomonas sp. Nm84 TaxID=200124 RepID=UPI000D755523|nr:glyoxal oxidase [Nitrosomonas sp. Nm84]PXW91253.1 glyoxal oxidase-like protein [Nitrosomonas sp. Nm84]
MFKHFLPARGVWHLKYLITATFALFSFTYEAITPALATGPEVHLKGQFGPLHNWPIIPLAMMLMPDGRVFAYGTTPAGIQNAKLHYAIWDPSLGTGTNAFETLPNTTNTDIFCAGQALIPATGHALIVGGDALVNTKRNYANSDVNIFDPTTDTLIRQTQNMAYKRWYATAVTMPNGEHVILGGRNDRNFAGTSTIPATVETYSPIPEVRSVAGNWRSLSTANSDSAYGGLGGASWFYPRAWVNPQGTIFILGHNGPMYKLDISGTGTLTRYKTKTAVGRNNIPSVMFAPGRILAVRRDRVAVTVDINGTGEPIVAPAGLLAKDRQYGSATVLADGRVWVNGGSSTGNDLVGMALESELWDPNTGNWTTTASAATARLYHSASLLLPDGTVITGGGGAPGPLKQLNGEIFYPPYLFKTDGSGEFAPRPEIIDAPTTMITWDQEFSIEATASISKVTLIRVGAATHTFDHETRFFDLPVPLAGNIVTVRTPATANIAPPGFYMVFVWDASGVPSIARIIQIG